MALSLQLSTGGTSTSTLSSNRTVTQSKSPDLGLVRSVVGDILQNKAKTIEYDAAGNAQRTSAMGYDAEIASYGSTERTAELYGAYSKAASGISEMQAQRDALDAAGKQRSAFASSGFAEDADIVRSTLQKGYLQEQLVRTQGLFDQAGYLEQASAARAQANAAGYARGAALDTAGIYDAASAQASSYATNATAGLSSYLKTVGMKTSADDLLSGNNVGTELALAPKVVDTSSTGGSIQSEAAPQYNIKGGLVGGAGADYFTGYAFTREENPNYGAGLPKDLLNQAKTLGDPDPNATWNAEHGYGSKLPSGSSK